MTRGLVIGATHSSAGKTTVSLGLMAALKARGLAVQAYKVGPDFIDPGHHQAVTGRPSRNLDGWMLSREANLAQLEAGLGDSPEVAVIEGVMGLFDGLSGRSEAGSTAQMAKWLGLPVVLVVDARSMARSAGALVLGFKSFDPELTLAGVIFNRIGSPGHLRYLEEALEGTGVTVLGGLPRDSSISVPERHLGLTTAEENPLGPVGIGRLAGLIEANLDLDRVLDLAAEVEPESRAQPSETASAKVRIGVARDKAFCFYYQANLEALQRAGAELVFFSPLSGRPPGNIDGLYLGGGYPELFAEQLAGQTELMAWITDRAGAGLPIYAECGGFMFLCREMIDQEGRSHRMTGLFELTTAMGKKFRALGYRRVELLRDCLLGRTGDVLKGHEFHYSGLTEPEKGPDRAYLVRTGRDDRQWEEGFRTANVLGSYVHLHFESGGPAEHFIRACVEYKRGIDEA